MLYIYRHAPIGRRPIAAIAGRPNAKAVEAVVEVESHVPDR
jgi:hypothetical protein